MAIFVKAMAKAYRTWQTRRYYGSQILGSIGSSKLTRMQLFICSETVAKGRSQMWVPSPEPVAIACISSRPVCGTERTYQRYMLLQVLT
jgi:hypothetical protein